MATASNTVELFIKSMQSCGYAEGEIYRMLEEIGERHGVNVYMLNDNTSSFGTVRLNRDDVLFLAMLKVKKQMKQFAEFSGISSRTLRSMLHTKGKKVTKVTWEKFVVAKSEWERKEVKNA